MKWTPQIQLSSQSPQVLVVSWYFESSPCIIYVLSVSFTYQVTSLNQSESSNSMGARLESWVATSSLWSKNTHLLLLNSKISNGKILHVKTNPKCSYLALSQFPAARVTFKRIKLCRSSYISGCRVNPYERILEIHRWWHPPFSKQVSYILACSRAHLGFFLSTKELTSRSS